MPRARHTVAALALLAIAATGCHDNKQHGEEFADQEHPTTVGLAIQAQAAAGAKQDGTLYDMHFRGDRLSPLGQGKLSLILKGTAAGDPVDVYLDLPADLAADRLGRRKAAVAGYLQQAGVTPDQVTLAVGPNPHVSTPTAGTLNMVYRPDGTAADQGVTGGLGTAGPGGTGGK